jgi:hypothetical protein
MNGIKAACVPLCLLFTLAASAQVAAQDDSLASDTDRQSREDAWWTGPILAAGANTLPKGHTLIEPYVFDSISRGRYDNDGKRQDTPRRHSHGSLTYMLYGLVEDFTVGIIPRFVYTDVGNGLDSSGIGAGDFSVQGTYRLMQFREGSRTPTMSIVLQETLPTGKYGPMESAAGHTPRRCRSTRSISCGCRMDESSARDSICLIRCRTSSASRM